MKRPRVMWDNPIDRSVKLLRTFDRRRREYKKLGWIYAARNGSFTDPVFKIGQTKVSPRTRVEQLSGSTSVYRPFELAYFVHISDRDQAESYVHGVLQNSRVNPGREFFEAPIMTVIRVLDDAARQFPIPLGRTPRTGFLEPALGKRIVPCTRCTAKNRLPQLLVDISVTCSACRSSFTLVTDIRSNTSRR